MTKAKIQKSRAKRPAPALSLEQRLAAAVRSSVALAPKGGLTLAQIDRAISNVAAAKVRATGTR
ncbi:MAG: hypothetical protein ABL996_17170 [Micropepsaceae bacterium]